MSASNLPAGPLLALLLLGACEKEARVTVPTDNPNFAVSELFTHAGCTVYRFTDNGDPHYWARCWATPGTETTSAETTRTESCGKSCTKQVSDVVTTEGRRKP